jgi:hypothetical protein
MSKSLNLLQNSPPQEATGPTVGIVPLNGETLTFTLSGTTAMVTQYGTQFYGGYAVLNTAIPLDPNAGTVFIDLHDGVFGTWTPIATLTPANPVAFATVNSPTADALRARLVGGTASTGVSVSVALSP